jgi:hypothetical protein
MKKIVKTITATVMALAIATGIAVSAGSTVSAEKVSEQNGYVDAAGMYDKYTTINYESVSGIEYDNVRVSASSAENVFSIRFDYFGVDVDIQVVKSADNEYQVTNADFFYTDAVRIVKQVAEEGKWVSINR